VRWFEDVYYLKRLVLIGDDVRVLHAYAGDWQVSAATLPWSVVCNAVCTCPNEDGAGSTSEGRCEWLQVHVSCLLTFCKRGSAVL
jgi:hypothetical protein